MRPARVLVGIWLGACTSAPAHEAAVQSPVPIALVAAAIPAPPAPVRARVLVGGDVMPHRPQLETPESVALALSELSPLFHSADATIVNYETATGTLDLSRSDPAALTLVASPAWMKAVVSANVTALTLANNHACDLGARGLASSVSTARELGVAALGADEDAPWKARTIFSSGSHRACAVAWTTFVNDRRPACADSRHLAVAKPNREGRMRVARAIAAAFHDGCDAVIAIAHGGLEYAPQTEAMMSLARAAANAGADAVVLHHPHVVSPLVTYVAEDGRLVPIFASVGNLVSNQGESWTPAYPAAQHDRHIVYLNGWTRIGMLADLDLRLDTPKHASHVEAYGYHVIFVESDHVLDKSNPHPRIVARPLDPDDDRALIDKLTRDEAGPHQIFTNPCWIEHRGADATAGPACSLRSHP
jgi:poly-gamma-glutamate capsule biosynthesis protein CapA/YwtB (metallophosphatase superfamily)